MNKILIPLLLIILVGCSHSPHKPFIIKNEQNIGSGYSLYGYECYKMDYLYHTFIDSTNKYNIGDTIK